MFDSVFTKNRIILSVLLILFVVSTFASLNQFFLYTPDSARYVAWANSLAQFNGFTDNTAPEAKRYMVHSPLYSLLISPIVFLFPADIIKIKLVNIILSSAIAIFLYMLIKNKKDELSALLMVTIFILHPMVFIFSTQILTEVLFGLGFISLLFYLQKEVQDNSPGKYFILTMISLLVCMFSREIGILCVPIVFFFYALRKNYTKTILVFFIPLILYSIWFIRNEIYYANIEQAEFKNSLIYFSNTMTSSDTNFGIEMISRIVNNAEFYLKEVAILMFTPVYDVFERSLNIPWMALVDFQSPIMKNMIALVNHTYWILSISSICMIVYGIIIEYRQEKSFYIKIIFFTLYVGIILSYPVLDTRFLYPIFLIFLLWFGSALSFIRQKTNRIQNIGLVILIMIFSLPNLVWTLNFVTTQHRLINDPLGSFFDPKDASNNVKHFQIVLPITGEWLNNQHDSSDVVLTPYKELSLYMKDKKVFVLNRIAPTSTFNKVVQDYDVHFVVLNKDIYGWRDYEIQFEQNDRYAFQRVFDTGAIEIYKILPKSSQNYSAGKYFPLFSEMKNKNYVGADIYFTKNRSIVNNHADLLYLNVLNKHYQDQLDSAANLLERLYSKPQGLSYTKLASIHKTLISRRELLQNIPFSEYRSNLLMNIGITYWQIDMKDVSLKYFQQCIDEDSTEALAYVYKIIFAIENGDTTSAIKTHKKLRSVFPIAELTQKIDSLMGLHERYRKSIISKEQSLILEGLFDLYQYLGFTVTATEVGKTGLLLDPERISLYKKLGVLYEKEFEYLPSLKSFMQFEIRNSDDPDIKARIKGIKHKLYINN